MKFRVEVISVNDEGSEQRRDVMEMERDGLAVETLGRRQSDIAWGTRLRRLPTNKRGFETTTPLPRTVASGTTAKQPRRAP